MRRFSEFDRQIIFHLNADARLSSAELARDLKTAERTVRRRIQRLIDEGVIAPIAVINPEPFGFTLVVDIVCEVELALHKQILDVIAAMPEVCYIAYATGDEDISVQARFRDSQEVHKFITERLHAVPGIRRTRIVLVPQVVKDAYQWLPPADAFAPPDEDEE